MKKVIITSLLLFLGLSFYAQKASIHEHSKEHKDALKHLKTADKLMSELPEPSYDKALEHYLIALDYMPKSSYANYNAGICYLNTAQKHNALPHFQKANELNPEGYKDINFFLGLGNQLNMNWDKAIEHYEKYKEQAGIRNNSNNPNDIYDVNKKIFECQSGKNMPMSSERVWIQNMGIDLNSKYSEYGMILTADASEIFYTSRRPTGSASTENAFEGIYTSNRLESNEWTPAKRIDLKINHSSHYAPVALSPDGGKMILYIDDSGDGNLYESLRNGDTWEKPVAFNSGVNSPYHESSAWYSPDGKQLYFVSNRPARDGVEAKDRNIFVATWDEGSKEWGNITLLPETINTEYDEDGIYMHPDGKTIYFSSKGHNSMGGYDVFKSVKQNDGTWSQPENLGHPINTPADDVFFTVAANGRDGFITSYRSEGLGEKDLYKVIMLGDRKEPLLAGEDLLLVNDDVAISSVLEPKVSESRVNLMLVKGVVRDSETKQPLRSDLEIVDNEIGKVIAQFSSNSKSGRYLITLPSGKNYGVAVKSQNYLFHSENFNLKDEDGYQEVELDIDLQKLGEDSPDYTSEVDEGEDGEISIILKNIFFDYDRYTLRKESIAELNRVVSFMKEYPNIKIKISGYTDSRGSQDYNKNLSENRAKSVVDYLNGKGINRNRMAYQGYGKENPIISDSEINRMTNEDAKENAHQQNRRTEFSILK